jgi:hypothetical protein
LSVTDGFEHDAHLAGETERLKEEFTEDGPEQT